MREPPAEFVRRLKAQQGQDWDVRWNYDVDRWELLSPSTAGVPVSQFWGWYKNPVTGKPIEADPVTGLVPFRDIQSPEDQEAFLRVLAETDLRNGVGAPKTWREHLKRNREFNRDLHAKRARERGWTIANLIKEVDLRRPWVKYHKRSRRQTFVPVSSSTSSRETGPIKHIDRRSAQ